MWVGIRHLFPCPVSPLLHPGKLLCLYFEKKSDPRKKFLNKLKSQKIFLCWFKQQQQQKWNQTTSLLEIFPGSFACILITTFSKLNFISVSPCRALCELCILQSIRSNSDPYCLTPWYWLLLSSKIAPASD